MGPKLPIAVDCRQWLSRMSSEEIDQALHFVEILERGEIMTLVEAARWRWKLLACWAETQRRPGRTLA